MKNLFVQFILVLATVSLFGQVPQTINYQAVARFPNGTPMVNTTVNLTFKILQGQFGNVLFREDQTNVSVNSFGLFTAQIGKNNPGDFSNIDWSTGSKWLEVTLNNDPNLRSNQELVSVPFALYSGGTKLDIAIFEERTPKGLHPPLPPGDFSWNKRILTEVIRPSNSVELNGPNLRFKTPGTYLITASAPAFKCLRHKLCLREAGTSVIKLEGSSEYSSAVPITGGGSYGIQTRSFINGILVVTNTNKEFYLDHYIQGNTGGNNALGVESDIPNTSLQEIFAQISIQKIQ